MTKEKKSKKNKTTTAETAALPAFGKKKKVVKEKFVPPKRVQDIIPIKVIYDDGIIDLGNNRYSKTWQFSDINFATASSEDEQSMFLQYSAILNGFDASSEAKITVYNRKLNQKNFEKRMCLPMAEDDLDVYRKEYNKMMLSKASGASSLIQERYVTVTAQKKDISSARSFFARIGADLSSRFGRLGSKCTELDAEERLRIYHDFYRNGEESSYRFDINEAQRRGHDFKDYICPDSLENERDYFRMGDKYGRALFIREYGSFVSDTFVSELCELNRTMMFSIDVTPVPTDEAIKLIETRLMGVESNITRWQQNQNRNNNFSATVPYDMEQQRANVRSLLEDLTTRDQRLFYATMTIVHLADSKEQLDSDTETLKSVAGQKLCQLSVLNFQQLEGLNTAMPYGIKKIEATRTLKTESLSAFIPFRVQDVFHNKGIYYGTNVISKNMIVADRKTLLNGNSFTLGVSGSGKSFAAKQEIATIVLSDPNADVLIIDPEREYSPLVDAMGGQVIRVSAASANHINAMDINKEYGGDDSNPVIFKSEFILSLCEQIVGANGKLGARQKSIIDRCTANVYRELQENGFVGKMPTLQDFHAELLKQPEPEAKGIALDVELFTNGNLNTFAKETNVNTDNRFICYDILDLGSQLMPVGMLVVLDNIFNRITENREKGRNTYVFIDEIYLLFRHEYSANFLFTLWKRVRKYGAFCTGITQNVEDLLNSYTARTMLANSEFLVLLNQSAKDRDNLAHLLNISEEQMSHVTDVEAGHGLIKVGSSLIPFENKFPRDTKLYKLMTTKPGER